MIASVRRKGRVVSSLAGLAVVITTVAFGVPAAAPGAAPVHQTFQPVCSDSQYSATRDPSNPLELPSPPGPNPLNGAHFFVDGPAHGAAAGAIAQLLGIAPSTFPDNYSWAAFKQDLTSGRYAQQLQSNPQLADQVGKLEKIAGQPEPQRFSLFSGGGGPGAVYGQVQKILCNNLTADPAPLTIPIISTYLLYQAGYCETDAQILANRANFQRQVDEVAQGTGRHPAVFVLEVDAIGASGCMTGQTLADWEQNISYEINAISALPHTVVYIEGGYSDANTPAYTAQVLKAVGVDKIRGFFTNDTHLNWTINEVDWADRVAALTGAHYIVNTSQNGQGPLLNPNPVTQGIEDLCNPPGRGLGPLPTTQTGFPNADAFLWTAVPGASSGSCHGGPPGGTFWPARGIELAANASAALGPAVFPPVLGRSVDIDPAGGTVYVKGPSGQASDRLARGNGFIQLTSSENLATGDQIDARTGTVSLTVAAPDTGGVKPVGTFGRGLFSVAQSSLGATQGLTTLKLLEGAFRGAPSYATCPRVKKQAAVSHRVLQTLHAADHGSFQTRGRYSTGIGNTAAWDTIDRCDGTLTVVYRGNVLVTDSTTGKTILVHTGRRYLAQPRRRKKK
jgi:hypothetical protein